MENEKMKDTCTESSVLRERTRNGLTDADARMDGKLLTCSLPTTHAWIAIYTRVKSQLLTCSFSSMRALRRLDACRVGLYIIIMYMLPLSVSAQKKENAGSAISRNLELFNDIYKQLDLFYVDSLNADTVIGWGIRSMLQQVDPFTDYYPDDDEDLRQMATGKYLISFHNLNYHIIYIKYQVSQILHILVHMPL